MDPRLRYKDVTAVAEVLAWSETAERDGAAVLADAQVRGRRRGRERAQWTPDRDLPFFEPLACVSEITGFVY